MLAPDITVARALAWGTQQLSESGIETPAAEARRLLEFAANMATGEILASEERLLTTGHGENYASAIARRRRGEPFAYIVGQREFWSLMLQVTNDVLVPRPETELLVERALALGAAAELAVAEHVASNRAAFTVADLGTGSGCIALALAHERSSWRITATDTSSAALNVARANAQHLGLSNVAFALGDWCTALGEMRVQILVSNPPYVGHDEAALNDPALQYEPQIALTPGTDALSCLRRIIAEAPSHLLPGGWLLLEHGAAQAASVRALLVAQGFTNVTSTRDLAGIERVTEGSWRP